MKRLKESNYRRKKVRSSTDVEFDKLFKEAPEKVKHAGSASDMYDSTDHEDDSDFVLGDYQSDEEITSRGCDSSDEEEEEHVTKIYYCSRTHSQLSQFVREVQKSPYGDDTAMVTLGSRQNLCVNESVRRLASLSLMNERCRELQKAKVSADSKEEEDGVVVKKRKVKAGSCPFYKYSPLQNYKDIVHAEVKDIEQLVDMGKKMKACPYFGTRYAIPGAQLVALPYNTLLHRQTREACGIKLEGNVVIIDEAHNLLETISNIHSMEVTGAQVSGAHSQLSQYLHRYQKRLLAKNLLYVRQILHVLQSCIKYLGGRPGCDPTVTSSGEEDTSLVTLNEFLFGCGIDNMNLFKLVRYCEKSMISRKLHGFVEKYQPPVVLQSRENTDNQLSSVGTFLQKLAKKKDPEERVNNVVPSNGETETVRLSSPLAHIEGFLQALTNCNKDGRIIVTRQETVAKSGLKFLLLNPAVHFSDIVRQCRAVVLAGGTMQPTAEFKEQLFLATGVPVSRLLEFSCGHVIPDGQLLPLTLAKGPSGADLDFTFKSRSTPQMIDELGRLLMNVCNVVPRGIVCFFPSYNYEKLAFTQWEASGLLARINAKKEVYREPKKANQVDRVLADYGTRIKESEKFGSVRTGAILFCVVGGKMSEGINFSDDLGRCIVMVGLPFPNMFSAELKEKMDYLNKNVATGPGKRQPGQIYYENLCMKAVNQSIGRAIRHRDDSAAILLLDQRYARASVVAALPGWIAEHVKCHSHFASAFSSLRKFFTTSKHGNN
ncbi:PREDICTED: probable ATP-dependent RNA helicase DDX11 isoform X2 [Priapulus caudatus]|nr:PREDICTED: probable ATP-dependent RNA helicase DDX11 isoform X2 [Priapulus caudatus]